MRYGTIVLPDGLRTSRSYELDDKELDLLFEYVGMEKEKPAAKRADTPVQAKRR